MAAPNDGGISDTGNFKLRIRRFSSDSQDAGYEIVHLATNQDSNCDSEPTLVIDEKVPDELSSSTGDESCDKEHLFGKIEPDVSPNINDAINGSILNSDPPIDIQETDAPYDGAIAGTSKTESSIPKTELEPSIVEVKHELLPNKPPINSQQVETNDKKSTKQIETDDKKSTIEIEVAATVNSCLSVVENADFSSTSSQMQVDSKGPDDETSVALSYPPLTDEDMKVLKECNFGECYIPMENCLDAYERDKKAQLRKRLKQNEEKRRIEREKSSKRKHEHSTNEHSHKKDRRTTSPPRSNSSIHPPDKKFFRSTLCCVCKRVVTYDTFGKESLYCSNDCIQKKVNHTKKCVTSNEQLVIMDSRGMIATMIKRPTIDNLFEFLVENPKYQPMVNTLSENPKKRNLTAEELKKIEGQRNDAKKLLETQLQKRSKEANMNFSFKRYKEIAAEIERELFSLHGDLDVKYKRWLKMFINVINDQKNAYFRDVLRDKVPTKKLVTLQADSMYVAIESKPLPLQNSFETSLNSFAPKDEEEFASNTDPLNLLGLEKSNKVRSNNNISSETTKISFEPIKPYQRRPINNPNPPMSALDDILGGTDTTDQHNSHLYDARCLICKNKSIREAQEKEKLESKLEKEAKPPEKQKMSFPNRTDRKNYGDQPWKGSYNTRDDYDDDIIDYNDDDDIPPPSNKRDISPPSNKRELLGAINEPSTMEETPWTNNPHRIWESIVQFGRGICFVGSLTAIGNRNAFKIQNDLPRIIRIVGLINSNQITYLLRNMSAKKLMNNVVLFLLDQPSGSEGRTLYKKIYTSLRRDKFGIIDCTKDPMIRDGFVFVLEPDQSLPDELKELDGPGIPEHAELKANILVMIIYKAEICKTTNMSICKGTTPIQPNFDTTPTPTTSTRRDEHQQPALFNEYTDIDLRTRPMRYWVQAPSNQEHQELPLPNFALGREHEMERRDPLGRSNFLPLPNFALGLEHEMERRRGPIGQSNFMHIPPRPWL